MPESEKIRCNICDVMIHVEDAKSHSSKPSHLSLKSKLEGNLKTVKENKSYRRDDSVILQWKKSS